MPDKPETLKDYLKWLSDFHDVTIDGASKTYYQVATRALSDHLERSDFWIELVRQLPEMDTEYFADRSVYLFMARGEPEIFTKPFKSLIDKSFRKNVVLNSNWPDPPDDGWILPPNWLTSVDDVIRTYIVAKYLDGVIFLADRVAHLADRFGRACKVDFEAREEGYYAAHLSVELPAEIPLAKWDTEEIVFRFELQITTQMQEAIRTLTHPFYERRRSLPPAEPAKKWQWEYQSDEFRANYLAHTLHHLEGLIMDLRTEGGTEVGA